MVKEVLSHVCLERDSASARGLCSKARFACGFGNRVGSSFACVVDEGVLSRVPVQADLEQSCFSEAIQEIEAFSSSRRQRGAL